MRERGEGFWEIRGGRDYVWLGSLGRDNIWGEYGEIVRILICKFK